MYKLIAPFEYKKIYETDIQVAIKNILKDIKYFDNNLKISILDIKTGKTYSYIINKSLKL